MTNPLRSKPVIKLLINEKGEPESMLQRVCRQLDAMGWLSHTIIVTCQSQAEEIKNQICDHIPLVIEPMQKGTFPSVALASAFLRSKLGAAMDEVIAVLPVDAMVDSAFYFALENIPRFLKESGANLALLGSRPENPSPQFGYIVPMTDGHPNYHPVCSFVEKPNSIRAHELLQQNALWNCGVFVLSLRFILEVLHQKGWPTDFDALIDVYFKLPETSFDVEVTEKTSQSIVIPFNGQWNDLGSWEAVTDHLHMTLLGKGSISTDSINTHVVNELPLPVHVIGIPNAIIAASPNGILVADKKKASAIKQIINDDNSKHVVEKWGSDKVLRDGYKSQARLLQMKAGFSKVIQINPFKQEIWTVISGTGEGIQNDRIFQLNPGDAIKLHSGETITVTAFQPLEMIRVILDSNNENGHADTQEV
ncbi:MAG: sugar phosphate nucleotidyltransferase [Tuberibacillus sp.]